MKTFCTSHFPGPWNGSLPVPGAKSPTHSIFMHHLENPPTESTSAAESIQIIIYQHHSLENLGSGLAGTQKCTDQRGTRLSLSQRAIPPQVSAALRPWGGGEVSEKHDVNVNLAGGRSGVQPRGNPSSIMTAPSVSLSVPSHEIFPAFKNRGTQRRELPCRTRHLSIAGASRNPELQEYNVAISQTTRHDTLDARRNYLVFFFSRLRARHDAQHVSYRWCNLVLKIGSEAQPPRLLCKQASFTVVAAWKLRNTDESDVLEPSTLR
ncbi:hypothetical protein B0T16DRAFT_58394 [Cercophora newfieldiana]|uniref:Uncharacterized protein n=1 Tax=Cercophora newfieldiana TaxID=92897 RepID=A0AA40D1P9_9PEZI|nr:hypothetical protein B0T16DRAFT_58394 [Cercophora newfieldiana]